MTTDKKVIHLWENEVSQWIELFKTDTNIRLSAATELAFIGIRCRTEGKSVRGDFTKAATSVFPGISLEDFFELAMSDEREQVQCEAVLAIGELGGEQMIEPLLKRLLKLPSTSKLHAAIIRAVGKIGGPEIREYLFNHPHNENSVRSIIGLITQQEAHDESFSKELRRPVRRGPETATLAMKTRQTLQEIRDKHEDEYVRLLVKQILPA